MPAAGVNGEAMTVGEQALEVGRPQRRAKQSSRPETAGAIGEGKKQDMTVWAMRQGLCDSRRRLTHALVHIY